MLQRLLEVDHSPQGSEAAGLIYIGVQTVACVQRAACSMQEFKNSSRGSSKDSVQQSTAYTSVAAEQAHCKGTWLQPASLEQVCTCARTRVVLLLYMGRMQGCARNGYALS